MNIAAAGKVRCVYTLRRFDELEQCVIFHVRVMNFTNLNTGLTCYFLCFAFVCVCPE